MKRVLIPLACIGVLFSTVFADAADGGLKKNIPEIDRSLQLMVVTAPAWNSVTVTARFFERADANAPWQEAVPAWDAVTGKNGMAWGIGLHGTHPAKGPVKQEGDKRAPAGVFVLHSVFGYAPPDAAGLEKFPYSQITSTSAGVDDVHSRYYNRVVDSASVTKDWKSAEVMLLPDGRYRWGVIVEHNWKPEPGAGSCIFLHIWRAPGRSTVGCTAMSPQNLQAIIRRLDASKHPLLVQLPASEYAQRKSDWHLP